MRRPVEIPSGLSCFGAIDSHAHVDTGNYGDQVDAVLGRSFQYGLSGLVLIASGESEGDFREVQRRAEVSENCWFAAGIHPHAASRHEELWPFVESVIGSSACVALGEIGLDFHYDFSSRSEQLESFRKQVVVGLQRDLALVLHIRNAYEETKAILGEFGEQFRGVVHCFSGKREQALDFVRLGFHISFSGMLTFRQSLELRESVKVVPMERLMVETDSPYLAPEPFRGARNEPALVAYTLEEMARVKGVSRSQIAEVTMRNTRAVFRMG